MARYALVVGIAQYDNFRNLDKAATDAAAIARLLQVHGQYQVEPLPKRLVAAENRWELATDKKLTGKDLGQALETFLLEQANGHEALLYFAGHGFEVPGLGRKKKGYLATSDCMSDGRNAILFSDLNDLIRESSLSSLVMILDCCHGGSFLERTLLESTLTAFKEKKDYYLITACRSFERSREGEENGVFTASVLKGLQVENANNEGAITGDRLFDFVQRKLRQSGQEPIRMGMGRSITLVSYQPQVKTVTAVADEHGEVICPYQGLEAFTEETAQFFFGRQRIVEAIKQKLEQQPFVSVIGASGSGKSSVVRAGLMPWLEESGWHILEPIKPGFEPLAALRAVFEPFFKRSRSEIQTLHQLIARDSTGLSSVIERLPGANRYLLVVDQFEEVFTVCADEAERQRFIELITQVAEIQNSRLAVVTTMRADFLELCLQYASLTQLILTEAIFMPPLVGADLEEVIVQPAKRQGYSFEPGLLGTILMDSGKEPGFLPLLEFTLTKLWEKRDFRNRLLTLEQYEKLGGLVGALNLHAERVYYYRDYDQEAPIQERSDQEKEWIKQIFLRLVRIGDGTKDTRQRQPKARLLATASNDPETPQDLINLLEHGLIEGCLLVIGYDSSEPWVDLAHEALIEGWKRFSEWRQENRELLRLVDRLEDALREWSSDPQDENLIMGGLLSRVRENWQNLGSFLPENVKDFYQRSDSYEKDKVTQLELELAKVKEEITKFREQENAVKRSLLANASTQVQAINFLEQVGASIRTENEQNREVVIEKIPGSLSLFAPFLASTVDRPSDQDAVELFEASARLNQTRSERVGILFYREQADTLFRMRMAEIRLRNYFLLIPIPLASVEKVLLNRDACRDLLNEYIDRYQRQADLFDNRQSIGDTLSFFGRTWLLNILERELLSLQSIGLFGLRKSGKTSILLQLRFALRRYPVVHLDLQTYSVRQRYGADLFNDFLQRLHELLVSQGGDISEVSDRFEPFDNTIPAHKLVSDFARRVEALSEVLRKTGYGLPIICLIDEVERILPSRDDSIEKVEEFNAFFGVLRALSQKHRKLAFLVIDVHPDCSRINHWSQEGSTSNPIFQFLKEVFLPPFLQEETNTMIEDIGQLMGVGFDRKTVLEIYKISGGHPFVARQLASLLYKKVLKEEEGQVVWSVSNRYLNRAFAYSGVLKDYFSQSIWGDLEKRKLESAMSSLKLLCFNEEAFEWIQESVLINQLSKKNLTESQCQDALIWLQVVGLVTRKEGAEDSYQIRLPLLSKWLKMQVITEEINQWKIRE